ncbi:ABC transporter ATP-binding protein [Termitidicoccus mucosus]|uniref:Fe3+/spermidine/putrescine ABC transporter ATP-binding protein n=1 Tax=Termitidicoccus mucosus TaxID=1184151 RepID=A0A178IEZ5_9BACT|nr:Fe3+/spermidine/putrescine ABC transporter ATP-binding protein [Opitutaceae bacterium TSB47]
MVAPFTASDTVAPSARPSASASGQPSPREAILEAAGVTKRFGSFTAVNDVSFRIREGEFFTLVGPSGSGKTTLLRMLVGMEKPTAGDLLLRGKVINDLPPNRRPTCMVFQSLALFPHMSVGHNVEFPLTIAGMASDERRTRAWELLAQLHLDPNRYYDKNVMQCSGGERQRVALARALAYDPEIIFFDEPLSAIDARLRKVLQKELKDIQRRTGKTFCYVTHSLEEAMVMSDRVAILRAGLIEQIGTPDEIYAAPRNAFVAEFMGEVNLLPVTGRDGTAAGTWDTGRGLLPLTLPSPLAAAQSRKLLIRPESLRFLKPGEESGNAIRVRVLNEFSLGSRIQYHVEAAPGCTLTVERLREDRPDTGDSGLRLGWELHDSQLLET